MKMKKLVLVTLFSLILLSCNSSDDNSTNNLIGKWQLEKVEWSQSGGAFNYQPCSGDFYNSWSDSNSGCSTNDTFEFTPTSWIWVTYGGSNCLSSNTSTDPYNSG